MSSTKFNKNWLLGSVAVNNLGDSIFDVFIAWKVSNETGSFMNAVYIFATSVTFRALLGYIIGSIVDRFPKKNIIILSHVSSILVVSLLYILWEYFGLTLGIGMLFVLLNDINNELYNRAYISLSADTLSQNEYIKFQNLSIVSTRSMIMLGSAFAGIAIEYFSSICIFFINILTYIGSIFCIYQIKFHEEVVRKVQTKNFIKETYSELLDTIKAIKSSEYLKRFILIMFLLNLVYGYIPKILPLHQAVKYYDAGVFSFIKVGLIIGEVIGVILIHRFSKYVSLTFKASMLINVLIIFGIYLIKKPISIILLFGLYGLSDSLTQPLFSYTVSELDSTNRGKILGGIDGLILLSPSLGIFLFSSLSQWNEFLSMLVISGLFLIVFLIVSFNKHLNNIKLK